MTPYKTLLLFMVITSFLAWHPSAHEKSVNTTKPIKSLQASVDKPDPTHKGSVTGTVTDEKGNAIRKARVELTDPVTKEEPVSVLTDKKGHYIFSELLPGAYIIQATKNGVRSDTMNIKIINGHNAVPKLILSSRRM